MDLQEMVEQIVLNVNTLVLIVQQVKLLFYLVLIVVYIIYQIINAYVKMVIFKQRHNVKSVNLNVQLAHINQIAAQNALISSIKYQMCQMFRKMFNLLNKCFKLHYLQISIKQTLCESQNGYYSDYINNKCYSKCGDSLKSLDEECDDGNLLSGDGCDRNCKNEKKFICKDGICIVTINNNTIQPQNILFHIYSVLETILYIRILDNTNQHIICFQIYHKMIQLKINLSYILRIKFQKTQLIANTKYYHNISQIQLLQNSVLQSIKSQFFSHFLNQALIEVQKMKNQLFNIKIVPILFQIKVIAIFNQQLLYTQQESFISAIIPEYKFIEESAVAQVQMATNGNQYVLYVIGAMCGGAILFGGLDIFYNLLDIVFYFLIPFTIQMLSYLKYINAQMPYNLQEFFDFFGFAQLNFISKYLNIQELIDPYISYKNQNLYPQKLEKMIQIFYSSQMDLPFLLCGYHFLESMCYQHLCLKFYNNLNLSNNNVDNIINLNKTQF